MLSNKSVLFTPIGVIVLSALAYFCSTGFYNLWPLTWFAPLPVLLFSLYEKDWYKTFGVAWAAYFLGSLNVLNYLITSLRLSLIIPHVIFDALVFALIVLFFSYCVKKTRSGWSVFIFPVAWVSYEFITSFYSSAGTLNSIGYSQLGFLPVVQIASITGVWGISFLLGLVPSALAVWWYLRRDKAAIIKILVLPIFILLVVLCFGFFRLTHQIPAVNNVTVGLAAIPRNLQNIDSEQPAVAQAIVHQYLETVPLLKQQGASIIVFPERIATTLLSYQEMILDDFKIAARANQVTLIFTLTQIIADKKFNRALVISPQGEIVAQYEKQHLMPGPESRFVIGRDLSILTITPGKSGIAICKDMDFTHPALQYGKAGVGILFVPAFDFLVDGWLHAKPAIMRGIEGGYSVVRAAQAGLLTVSNRYGQLIAKKPTTLEQVETLVATVPIYSGQTFYSRYGDWFGWLMVVAFIGSLIICIYKGRK